MGSFPASCRLLKAEKGEVGEDLSRASRVRWSNSEDRAGGGMAETGGGSSIPGMLGDAIAGVKYSRRGGTGMAVMISSSTRIE